MPHWLFKTLLFLALLVVDVVIGVQIFQYWAGMAYFPLIGTLITAAFHAAVILLLAYIHVLLFKYKKV